jgi:hypothetical protein
VFRFFNTKTGTHFFTQSTVERDSIIENLPLFNLKGEAYLGYTEQVARDLDWVRKLKYSRHLS